MKTAVEAVLFAAGKFVEEDFIAKVLQLDKRALKKALGELREDYDKRTDCALRVANEGTQWKLTVRDEYLGIASKLVSDTEIQGTVLETLAVIAWKNPIMQSELIKIRGPAAYEHIAELAERGFVTKVAAGRSFKLTLLDKFFAYFDVEGREDLKKLFGSIDQQAAAAQAEIDAKQAAYDSEVKRASEAVQGTNSDTSAPQQPVQPSAQQQVATAPDLLSEIKAAADKLSAAPLPELKEQPVPPAQAPPVAVESDQEQRVSGTMQATEAIVEVEKAVDAFGKDIAKLKDEIAHEPAAEKPHSPKKSGKHPSH